MVLAFLLLMEIVQRDPDVALDQVKLYRYNREGGKLRKQMCICAFDAQMFFSNIYVVAVVVIVLSELKSFIFYFLSYRWSRI